MLHDGALLTFMVDPSKLNFTNIFLPAKLKLYQKNEMPRDKGKYRLSKSPMSLKKFSSHASYIITVLMILFLKEWADRRKLLEKHHTNRFFFRIATFAVRQRWMMDINEA